MMQESRSSRSAEQGRRRPPKNVTSIVHHKSGIVHQDTWASTAAAGAASQITRRRNHGAQPTRPSMTDTPRGHRHFFCSLGVCIYLCVGKNLTKFPIHEKDVAAWKIN